VKRAQDLLASIVYFTKYSRSSNIRHLQSNFAHLGYVRFTMLGSCLTSATVMSFYFDGSTTWISGVSNGDMVTLHGNAVSQYVEAPIGVFGQLVTSPPVLNTAFPSGVSQDASVCTLTFSSGDIKSSSSASIAISEARASGSTTATVSAGDFSHAVNFTVVQLGAPTLQVDDSEQQALPGSCGGCQSTRLSAISDGVDIARLLTFQTTSSAVLSIDASVPAPGR
jgi:hypothetical protein